jgi:hypothetical protein
MVRPNDPIPFIANFMLRNKHTMKTLDEYIKLQVENEKLNEKLNQTGSAGDDLGIDPEDELGREEDENILS